MYKYFRQERSRISSTESQCKFTPRQSYHFLSNLPHTHLFKHAMIFRISSLPLLPLPPVRLLSKYARAISRYATGRLRIIYTRLSLRPASFHDSVTPRRILPAGRPPRAKDNLRSVRNGGTPFEKKKKSKKRGRWASNGRFSRRFYELT